MLTCRPGIWMCRGQDMNVMVMDVEGTDGRERGEDQVSMALSYFASICSFMLSRTSSANQHYSRWPPPKCSSSICGSTKLVSTREQTWAFSRPFSK